VWGLLYFAFASVVGIVLGWMFVYHDIVVGAIFRAQEDVPPALWPMLIVLVALFFIPESYIRRKTRLLSLYFASLKHRLCFTIKYVDE